MSRHLKIAAAQLGPIHLADTREAVVKRLIALMREAHGQGARFIVFPELALTTFFPRWWMEEQSDVDRRFFETAMPSPITQPLFDEDGHDHRNADLQRPALARGVSRSRITGSGNRRAGVQHADGKSALSGAAGAARAPSSHHGAVDGVSKRDVAR